MRISQKLRILGLLSDFQNKGPGSKANYDQRKRCEGIRKKEKEKKSSKLTQGTKIVLIIINFY